MPKFRAIIDIQAIDKTEAKILTHKAAIVIGGLFEHTQKIRGKRKPKPNPNQMNLLDGYHNYSDYNEGVRK